MSVYLDCDRCGEREKTGSVMLFAGLTGPAIPTARPELPAGWTRPQLPTEDGELRYMDLCPGCRADLLAFMVGRTVAAEVTCAPPAVVAEPGKEDGDPRTVCVCGHTRGKHLVVSGRLLCDECDPDSTENLVCKEFEAL